MRQNFAAAMKIELTFEGGKVDDPIDPGGRTNQGVIQRVFNAYLMSKGKPVRDVWTMLDAERDEIYKTQYADRVRFDDLPPGVDLVVLDGAINSGVSQSVKWLQRALGLTADGVMGIVTLQATQNHPDHDVLIANICERRMAFLRALKTFYRFGNGWTRRVQQVKAKGQAWAMGSVGPAVLYAPEGNRKAMLSDAKKAPARAPADAVASGGTVTTTLGTIQGVFEPMRGSPFIDNILLGLVVLGALCVVFGLVYGMYARRKKAELEDVLDIVAAKPANDDVALFQQRDAA